MMSEKTKNLNKWVKIGIGLLATAVVFMAIGLGCLGAKASGGFFIFSESFNFYNCPSNPSIGDALKGDHGFSEGGGVWANVPEAWTAGAVFAVILTPIVGGIGLISLGYGTYKGKK